MKKITKKELLEEIKLTLQREEEISLDTELEKMDEWDSLAYISIISLYDRLFDFIITIDKLKESKTIDDLIKLVSNKLDK
ncbi:acyl carrier protein [Pelagibacterales bacterium SAG-MED22]|nr:acyl carrier protein [Pelagibacterales bacterium SAG-MED22]